VSAASSTFFLQAASGDFAAFLPRDGGGVEMMIRQNNLDGAPWRPPVLLFGSHGDIGAVTALELDIAGARAFHTVCLEGGRLVHDWGVEPAVMSVWHGAAPLPGGVEVTGAPAMVESQPGLLHVVAPVKDGAWRTGKGGAGPWRMRPIRRARPSSSTGPDLCGSPLETSPACR